MLTKLTRTLAAGLLLTIGALPVAAQSGKTYKARLSPVPMTTAMASTVAGLGSASVQVHRAPKGIRGPVVFDLKATSGTPNTSGTISGTIELTPTQIADLDKGWLYIQLHSERAPDGNLWGWLLAPESKK
jgi:hypothetical protein